MTVQELKKKVESYRLKTKSGKITAFSEAGPVGMDVIDSVVSVLEAQEKRIEKVEQKLPKVFEPSPAPTVEPAPAVD
jgi:hypothetical protein